MTPKSKIILAIVAVIVAVTASVAGIRFISQRISAPSIPGQPEAPTSDKTLPASTKTTPIPAPSPFGSSQSKDDAAAQIRSLNNISNEYNNYNNAANQMNASNTSL